MKNKYLIGFLLILFFLLFTLLVLVSFKSGYQKIQKIKTDYYRNQMLSFCKITEIDNNIKYPGIYPCEKWLLSGDKEENK